MSSKKEKEKIIEEDKKKLEKKAKEVLKEKPIKEEIKEGSLVDLVNNELNKEKKTSKFFKLFLFIFIILFVIVGFFFIYKTYIYDGLKLIKISESNSINSDNTKKVDFYIDGNKDTKCSIDGENWINISFGKCSFNLSGGTYTYIIKNGDKEVKGNYELVISELSNVSFNIDTLYIAKEEKYKPVLNKENISSSDDIKWTSSDEKIVTVEDGIVNGIDYGEAQINVLVNNKKKASLNIVVTKLLVKPVLNDKKTVVKCKQYTEEEAAILDKALFARVNDKGEGTRAAAVEVSRFLTLSFEYKIPYFYENGRMDYPTSGIRKADGEGRYYHKGLYLSEDKYDSIETSYKGPAMWGCPLTNLEDHGKYKPGNKMPNGLDCSGYVTWCLYNAGVDVGDIGAGINDNVKEMSDVGEMHSLTYDFVMSGEFKVGDIIARWGHTAIIAGIDDEYIYISESLLKGVRIEKYKYKDKSSVLYTKGWYTYINDMDKVYKEDGEYSNMWLNATD